MHKHDLIMQFLKSTDFVKVAVASCEVCKYRGDYESANKWFSVAASLMSQSEMYLEGGIDYYGLLTLEMVIAAYAKSLLEKRNANRKKSK